MQDDTKKCQLGNKYMGLMGQIGPNMGQNMRFIDFMDWVGTLRFLVLIRSLKAPPDVVLSFFVWRKKRQWGRKETKKMKRGEKRRQRTKRDKKDVKQISHPWYYFLCFRPSLSDENGWRKREKDQKRSKLTKVRLTKGRK